MWINYMITLDVNWSVCISASRMSMGSHRKSLFQREIVISRFHLERRKVFSIARINGICHKEGLERPSFHWSWSISLEGLLKMFHGLHPSTQYSLRSSWVLTQSSISQLLVVKEMPGESLPGYCHSLLIAEFFLHCHCWLGMTLPWFDWKYSASRSIWSPVQRLRNRVLIIELCVVLPNVMNSYSCV